MSSRVALISAIAVTASLAVTACASQGASGAVSTTAFTPVSEPAQATISHSYRIGPQDKLNISVFQVKELTLEEVQVDGSGNISLPLIGNVVAGGRTATELSTEIANRLRGQYLQSPQVSVSVAEAISQKVTVDGSVIEPGVYKMSGPTTLLQAVAMAKGPDPRAANLSRVAVFRTVDGQRTAAVFDIKAIRAGRAPDPEIIGNDVIVVEGSAIKGAMREVLSALPGLAIFRPY